VSHCAAIREWYEEVWNKRDLSAITRMMAPDVVVHGLAQGGGALHGPDGFLQFHRAFTQRVSRFAPARRGRDRARRPRRNALHRDRTH
jgi:ketosteroid isomerase-like protein